jgi:hypothetical protein
MACLKYSHPFTWDLKVSIFDVPGALTVGVHMYFFLDFILCEGISRDGAIWLSGYHGCFRRRAGISMGLWIQ